jgi:hypothetical protein
MTEAALDMLLDALVMNAVMDMKGSMVMVFVVANEWCG